MHLFILVLRVIFKTFSLKFRESKVEWRGVNLKMIVLVTAFLPIMIPTIVSAALDLSLLLHCYPCFQKIIFAIFQGCYAESSSADSLPDSYGETGHHIT